jgi:hypothetical protein
VNADKKLDSTELEISRLKTRMEINLSNPKNGMGAE